jgi:hypothetical protein
LDLGKLRGDLFNHLVSGDQQGLRKGQPKSLGRPEIDHLFEAGRLFDRQVRRLCAA